MGVKTSSWTRSLRNRLALKPRPCGHPGREQHVLEGQRKEALSSPGGTSLGPAPSSGRQRHCRNFPLEKSRTCPSLRRQSPATVLPGSASCFDWRPSASQAAPRQLPASDSARTRPFPPGLGLLYGQCLLWSPHRVGHDSVRFMWQSAVLPDQLIPLLPLRVPQALLPPHPGTAMPCLWNLARDMLTVGSTLDILLPPQPSDWEAAARRVSCVSTPTATDTVRTFGTFYKRCLW